MADESDVRFAAIINMPSVENVVENRVHITSDPHMRDTWLMEMKEADKRREGWGSELYKSFREESGQMLCSAKISLILQWQNTVHHNNKYYYYYYYY